MNYSKEQFWIKDKDECKSKITLKVYNCLWKKKEEEEEGFTLI